MAEDGRESKNGAARRANPRFRRERAVAHNPISPADAEEGILETPRVCQAALPLFIKLSQRYINVRGWRSFMPFSS